MSAMLHRIALFTSALTLSALTAFAAAPTFQSLMDPSVFPDPQRGLTVEKASLDAATLNVATTGATMQMDTASGTVKFRQRIGHPREIATLQFEGWTALAPELTHTGPGLAFARFGTALDVRANGDSLFMFHLHQPMTLSVTRAIDAVFFASDKTHHLLQDEWGGFGIYCSERNLNDAFDPFGPVTARYTLPVDAVLWISIFPPKPYNWERSIQDHVVWHWSNTLAYPPDADLINWSNLGNIVLLQAEVMLWKDWNLAFEPRLGPEEFARVRKTLHERNRRFIVYTSPAYFFKGTELESAAFNSFENFANWPPFHATGENIDLFIDEITKVMTQYQPDGLYFDGQYIEDAPSLYALARRARAVVGENGILEWHSTLALGHGLCSLPPADAYLDFLLRGESQDTLYNDPDYLRFFVSGYNTSNTIGVLCNNGPKPTPDLIKRVLNANCRMHTLAGWMGDPALMEMVANEYRAKLTPEFQATVEHETNARQAQAATRAKARADELAALKAQPAWSDTLLVETFKTMPAWEPLISPQNTNPFTSQDGDLHIHAKAHTYAFLRTPITGASTGFVVKIRQQTDGGMSWGPAAALKYKNGAIIRIGLRCDRLIQADINGTQWTGGQCDPAAWIWIRARWLFRSGVIEISTDGSTYQPVYNFDHAGVFNGELESLSIGKVPYNAQPADHFDPGPEGDCDIGEVVVY